MTHPWYSTNILGTSKLKGKMHKKKGLPIGIQSFKRIIEENYVYIDKTRAIHEITSGGLYYFLSRPQKFGKTLLLSTMAELFKGNRTLFKSLYIDSTDYSWEEYPVIRISFATMAPKSASELRKAIEKELSDIAQQYGVEAPPTVMLGWHLKTLILKLAKKNKVALLIDDYDAPILKNIDNVELAEECRKVFDEFFSALKDGEVDKHLKFVFITAQNNFSRTSPFGGLNNVQDLSLDPRAAQLLGFTENEIKDNFQDYLLDSAEKSGKSVDNIVDQMRFWYGGYQFVDPERKADSQVYNPYSVLHYVQSGIFDSYLINPQPCLPKHIKSYNHPFSLDETKIHRSQTKNVELSNMRLIPFLFHEGYLTIESYN